jgi:hypothetical protein
MVGNSASGRPEERVTASGETIVASTLEKLVVRTVKCNDGGSTLTFAPGENQEYSHIKTTFLNFNLKEKRRDPTEGTWDHWDVRIHDKKKEQVA